MEMAALQLLVGEPGIFTTEYQSHLTTPLSLLKTCCCAFARIKQRPGDTAVAGARSKHQRTAYQRLLECRHDLGAIEDVSSTGSSGHGIRAGKILWIDKHQT